MAVLLAIPFWEEADTSMRAFLAAAFIMPRRYIVFYAATSGGRRRRLGLDRYISSAVELKPGSPYR